MKMASQICCNQIYPVTALIQKLIKEKMFCRPQMSSNFTALLCCTSLSWSSSAIGNNKWVVKEWFWTSELSQCLVLFFFSRLSCQNCLLLLKVFEPSFFSASLLCNSTMPSVCLTTALKCLREETTKCNLGVNALLFKQVLISIKVRQALICAGWLMAGKSCKVKSHHSNVQMLQFQSLPRISSRSIHCM